MKTNGLKASIEKVEKLRSIHDNIGTVTYQVDEDASEDIYHDSGCTCSNCDTVVSDDVELNSLVEEHVIKQFDDAWDEHQEWLVSQMISAYGVVGEYAYSLSNGMKAGVSVHFMHSDVRDDLANQAKLRIESIKGTTKSMLATQLSKAYEGAEDVSSWMTRIKSVMQIPNWRADMIARSELAYAFNRSNQSAYKEAGVVKVRWLAVVDDRTCPTCRSRHNNEYDLHDVPSIPAHPRCRCTTVAIL